MKPQTSPASTRNITSHSNNMAMSIGKPLLGPLDHGLAVAAKSNTNQVVLTKSIYHCLKEWWYIIKLINAKPTFCKQLILHPAAYQGFVDASGWRVVGVWFGRGNDLQPMVWFLEWPNSICDKLITEANPTGTISNSKLELAGVILHWLVLEMAVDEHLLKFALVAIWCDNIAAIAWLYKMRSSSLQVTSNLIWALAIRFHVKEAAKLAGEHISAKFNKMVDVASREHVTHLTDFLTFFTSTFMPKKGHFWTLCQLKRGTYSRVISKLLGERLPLVSWKQLPEKGANFWQLGNSTYPIELQRLTQASLIEQTMKSTTVGCLCSPCATWRRFLNGTISL